MSRLKNHPLITGTIILTLTGLASRIIGFFYRIYLSRLFGEEGMGIYQLLSPVLALSFSLTAAGIQTAISKFVAGEAAAAQDSRASYRVLLTGLTLSTVLSLLCTGFLLQFAEWIGSSFLLEPRTASMLRIVSLSIPMAAVHACINGYFYGIKKTSVPASTQLIEQIFRVGSVALLTTIGTKKGMSPTINVAVLGLVIGECASMLVAIVAAVRCFVVPSKLSVTILMTKGQSASISLMRRLHKSSYLSILKNLLTLAVPLSLNRVVINFLQSIEAIYIPNRLMTYGYDTKTALSVYGVLTGMAMPLIFFPNALTNSVSVLLLPIISEADATGNQALIRRAVNKTIRYSALLGIVCMSIFLLGGRPAGSFLFHSPLAGHFIITLSFICPFMYLSSTLSSVINGLGKAGIVFFTNVTALFLRLAFVFLCIPRVGITGYLWGLLVSQFYTAAIYIFYLKRRR